MMWPTERTWSPIVRTVKDDKGVEWYLHADGSHSTTVVRLDASTGRSVAIGMVSNPVK